MTLIFIRRRRIFDRLRSHGDGPRSFAKSGNASGLGRERNRHPVHARTEARERSIRERMRLADLRSKVGNGLVACSAFHSLAAFLLVFPSNRSVSDGFFPLPVRHTDRRLEPRWNFINDATLDHQYRVPFHCSILRCCVQPPVGCSYHSCSV